MTPHIQTFDANGGATQDWYKPTDALFVKVICIGAGGGGGGGSRQVNSGLYGGGAGGGGGVTITYFRASDLPDHVHVRAGQGGTGGVGAAPGAGLGSGSSGTEGEGSYFGPFARAGGGGRGGLGQSTGGVAGGGGAWTDAGGSTAGLPDKQTSTDPPVGLQAGSLTGGAATVGTEYGGAPGSAGRVSSSAWARGGGSSIYGGPGGGGGGGTTAALAGTDGDDGGSSGYPRGGGATGGTGGGAPTAGADGASPVLYCGTGGGGGGSGVETAGKDGGDGGIGAGGGGGGSGVGSVANQNGGGNGGAGGAGRVIVISYTGTEVTDVISVVSRATSSNGAVSSNPDLTVTLPDYAADDLVFIHITSYCGGAGTSYGPNTPTGWTLLDTPPTGTNNRGPWVFYRVMDGTEGTTVTVSFTGYAAAAATRNAAEATSWRPGAGAAAFDGSVVVSSGSAAEPLTATAGAITTTKPQALILGFVSMNDGTSGSDQITSVSTTEADERYDRNDYGNFHVGELGLVSLYQLAPDTTQIDFVAENPNAAVTLTYRINTVAIYAQLAGLLPSFQAVWV